MTLDKGRSIESPGGLIHHWTGTTFIPGATVERTVALMQGYERYQEIYAPNVRRSRTIARQGDRFTVYLRLFMKKVIGVVLNTENDVQYTRLTPSRVHVRSYSTRIAEVRDPGTKAEAEAPVGNDSGFLWRFNNYCSLEGRAEGDVRAMRIGVVEPGDPRRPRMDRRSVRDEHPAGIARVHAGQHAEGADKVPKGVWRSAGRRRRCGYSISGQA